jgi:Arc/MetJ-type ribon-helix-helix transcriptional regulator
LFEGHDFKGVCLSDEFKLRKQMEEGARAKSVLDDSAYQNASKAVREAILEAWESCPIRDRDGAHELKLMLKIHRDIEAHMRKAVEDGRFASEELKQDRTFSERLKERLRIA